MMRKGEWLELRIPRETPVEVDATDLYLTRRLGVPESYIRRMRSQHDIERIGDRIRLRFFSARPYGFEPEWRELDVLYEDDFCLVVNKSAGLSIHPSERNKGGTLANAVAFHYESSGIQTAVRHIHRLDQWTSGPVLYAKNEFAQYKLDEEMREKRINRVYLAVVHGIPSKEAGTIDAPIGKDRHRSGKRRVSATGDEAVTHYETVEKYKSSALMRLQLATGRTHQIRVHMSHIGHPIVGDGLYGSADARIGRQALHGERLFFRHPLSGETIEVHAELPLDMQRLIGSMFL